MGMLSPASYQPRSALPNEFALAVACCRWSFAAAGAEDVRRLAEAVDWQRFVQTCRRHRIEGLAWNALHSLGVPLPAPAEIALAGDARAVAADALRSASESRRLAEAFDRAGLPLLFVKGLTTAVLAYGTPFLKSAWDIDIMVLPKHVAPAAQCLSELGYRLVVPARREELSRWHPLWKESIWRSATGIVVELHIRLADQDALLPGIDARSPTQIVEVSPGISLPTLAEEELFAYLCVHGASSAWFRLKWITDLAALLSRRDADRIEQLYERSQALGSGRAAAQALLLAERLYAIPLTQTLRARLGTPANRWLARLAVGCMLRGEPTDTLAGTLPIHLTQFFLKPGLGYKAGEMARQVRAAAGIY